MIGYPDVQGAINWSAHDFLPPPKPDDVNATSLDGDGAPIGATTPQTPVSASTLVYANGSTSEVFFARQSQKKLEEVSNPPKGWRSDQVFVRRTIHFSETSAAQDGRFHATFVEANDVELDPGEFGTLTDSLDVAVRADNAGVLSVGPIGLSSTLDASNQVVELQLQAGGTAPGGGPRPVARFAFTMADQDTERRFALYTGQPGTPPAYRYRVHVIVKGTLFAPGDEWLGPWVDAEGTGELYVRVPLKGDAGVTVPAHG
jgi:hypothetical protein